MITWRRRTRRASTGAAIAVVLATVAAGGGVTLLATGAPARGAAVERPGPSRRVLGPGPVTVRLDVRKSRFHPARIRVVPHTELRFEVVNHDFIDHELIIGDDAVHARHESGHEPVHPPVPGEVSVAPHTTGVTTYAFHAPGPVRFACHLPGHFAYGMRGTVTVVASPAAGA